MVYALASASLRLTYPILWVDSHLLGPPCIFATNCVSFIRTNSLYCLHLPLGWVSALHIHFAHNPATVFGTHKRVSAKLNNE